MQLMEGTSSEHPAQVNRETAPLGPTQHLLFKAVLTSPGDTEGLPNKQKQIQGVIQNEKTKKLVPNEERAQNHRLQSK